MSSDKDLKDLRKYSARNIATLEEMVGEKGLAALPALLARHQKLFKLDVYHETREENVAGIVSSGKVYSFDRVQKDGLASKAGMSHDKQAVDDMFNNVTHLPDAFTDYVYARPVFGGGGKGGTGVHWKNFNIREDMWFSFEDPNQLTFDDYPMIQFGMSVTKGFSTIDVYVGQHFPRAIALMALQSIAQVEYLGRLKKHGYEKQKALHGEDPRYRAPNEEDNMNFADALEYYRGIPLAPGTAWSSYSDTIFGRDTQEREKELAAAGLKLKYPGFQELKDEILNHPEFEQAFVETCRAIAKKIALNGQIAVPREMSVEKATVYLKGAAVGASAPKKDRAPKL